MHTANCMSQVNKPEKEKLMKKKFMAVIGMAVCFMVMTTFAWAENKPHIPPNGTLTDTSTGLVWLQNANCVGKQNLRQAMNSAASLKSGMCGLKDGSRAGQWRLPTKDELVGRAGNKQGFNDVGNYYWSSSSYGNQIGYAWVVNERDGCASGNETRGLFYVWPVRDLK